jgi:hypothetical protein
MYIYPEGNLYLSSDGLGTVVVGGDKPANLEVRGQMQVNQPANLLTNLTVGGDGSVRTLTIRGGADIAEPFKVSGQDIPEGSVVIIDDELPGQLRLSEQAYDPRVAGIISGANGIHPGLTLSQAGVIAEGRQVALSGRVYALADASGDAIRPGDLLTTSGTPGHCMKVIDRGRAQGAIIGKAMSTLNQGKGMVLVLVSLQ